MPEILQHHHPRGAVVAGSLQLFDGSLPIFPRQGGEPADAIWVGGLCLSHGVIGFTRCTATDFFVAPINIWTSQGNDGDVNARLVHFLNAHVVIKMALLRDDDRRVAPEHFLLAVRAGLNVVHPTFAFEQLEPFGREHVGVDINDGHARALLENR